MSSSSALDGVAPPGNISALRSPWPAIPWSNAISRVGNVRAPERMLRSVSRTRQRNSDHPQAIADLRSYLFLAFVHRFNRAVQQEQKHAERLQLVSSSVDLERIESAQDFGWVEELERAIAIREIADRMDGWTRKVWQARQFGYTWKEISLWLGVSEQQAKMKFQYGLEKTRQSIVRLLKTRKPKKG